MASATADKGTNIMLTIIEAKAEINYGMSLLNTIATASSSNSFHHAASGGSDCYRKLATGQKWQQRQQSTGLNSKQQQ